MNKYFMINGNKIESIIVSDDKETTEAVLRCTLIEITPENPAGIGWIYDEEAGKFIEPIEEENSPNHEDV